MKKLSVYLLVFLIEFSAIMMPFNASAAILSPGHVAAIDALIQRGTYSAGVAMASASEAIAIASGKIIPIATTATAAVSGARMGSLAGTLMKGASGIGIASILLPIIWDAYELTICAPPDFICKKGPQQTTEAVTGGVSLNGVKYANGAAACAGVWASMNAATKAYYSNIAPIFIPNGSNGGGECRNSTSSYYSPIQVAPPTCPSGWAVQGYLCTKTGIPVGASESDIASSVTGAAATPAKGKTIYDTLIANNQQVVQAPDPVTVTAPPVVLPADVETEQVNNPDGTTSTKVVSKVVTVTPTQVGTTVNNTTMSYPTSTVTTTMTTNNTTNIQTTTVTTKTENTPSVQVKPTEPTPDFCVTNPNLNVCKNSSISGACKEISCSGDAITCAIAQQAAEANCRAVKDRTELETTPGYTLGKGVMDGGADPLPDIPTKANGGQVNAATSLNSSGWLGGGQCFTDKTFTIQGKTIVIPFSRACDYLVSMRYAIMIVALLASFRIMSGAIIRET